MAPLHRNLRRQLENAVVKARDIAEAAAKAALERLAVDKHEVFGNMDVDQRQLRNTLRARGRAAGDVRNADGKQEIYHLIQACAYEHWHRMLFARFLAQNNLLMHTDGVPVTIEECKELAKEEGASDEWELAGRYASKMLPQIFRPDDPVLQVILAPEEKIALEKLLAQLPAEVFTAEDSLGWCYQFWQAERKDQVNKSGNKIGADELPAVTQLFTEDYMVDFLLDNTLGAWHAGKVLAANPKLAENARSEEELRQAVALPGCPWKYLRFIKGKDGKWTPAAGTFDGWPKSAVALRTLDPCMGSGHFVVAMFERLVALRLAEEKLDEAAAVAAVIRDNLFGLEIDPRCTQIGAFNLALAAWRRVGHCNLPAMNLACSGLAPNTKREEWLKLTEGAPHLRFQMGALYDLFGKAPVLGSLINPRADKAVTYGEAFHELQPLLEKALAQETKDDTAHEMAVTARGLAKAAEILASQFTLVATNVPYLGQKKQTRTLSQYGESAFPKAAANLATSFTERSIEFCATGCTAALVTPQNWLFLSSYEEMRKSLIGRFCWNLVARLGPKGFRTPMWDLNIMMISITNHPPQSTQSIVGFDVSSANTPDSKAENLVCANSTCVTQQDQLQNTDCRIILDSVGSGLPLAKYASALSGCAAGDLPRFVCNFWEIPQIDSDWEFHQSTVAGITPYSGKSEIIYWQQERGEMFRLAESVKHLNHIAQNWLRGKPNWGKKGVVISLMARLPATIYLGDRYDCNCCAIVPNESTHLAALWEFCSSQSFNAEVRKLNQKLNVTSGVLLQVPFDLAHWQKVAAEKYPDGLPKPFSSDPTQWLFNGHPAGADQPLHVAVARLLGYQWPRQTGSSFPDCPALGPDGLETLADDDGIVSIPAVGGEHPGVERLREFLAAAYGKEWSPAKEAQLLSEVGFGDKGLDEWLRNGFFEQHYKLFHHRPFIWHIWDGRMDGFSALVNYHKLDRKLLEALIYNHLGEWIRRQNAEAKAGSGPAESRLAAAQQLQEKLKLILEGQGDPRKGTQVDWADRFKCFSEKEQKDLLAKTAGKGYDIFIRWKPIEEQPIGWDPDLNDGVRMNIRPFVEADVLRKTPNIKWTKDRGKDPTSAPWYKKFNGERINDFHLSLEEKRAAREGAKKGDK